MTATERPDRTDDPTERRRPGWGWFCLLVAGGTLAWSVHFGLGYFLVPIACEVGDWVLHVVTVVTALAAIAALVLSLRWVRRTDDTAVSFTLVVGAVLDVFFLGVIVLEGSGVLFVDACLKGAIP